jgi:FlaA1/EpsC-like NDP-sugar epimerase
MQRKLVFKYLFFITFTLALVLTFLAFEPSTALRVEPEKTSYNYVVLVSLWAFTFFAIFTVYREVGTIKLGQIFEALTTGLSSSSLAAILLAIFPNFTGQPLSTQYLPYTIPILITVTIFTSYMSIKNEKNKKTTINDEVAT